MSTGTPVCEPDESPDIPKIPQCIEIPKLLSNSETYGQDQDSKPPNKSFDLPKIPQCIKIRKTLINTETSAKDEDSTCTKPYQFVIESAPSGKFFNVILIRTEVLVLFCDINF